MTELWQRQLESKQALVEGANAPKFTKCPYSKAGEPWRWASWLAGHYDAHGKEAWEYAR